MVGAWEAGTCPHLPADRRQRGKQSTLKPTHYCPDASPTARPHAANSQGRRLLTSPTPKRSGCGPLHTAQTHGPRVASRTTRPTGRAARPALLAHRLAQAFRVAPGSGHPRPDASPRAGQHAARPTAHQPPAHRAARRPPQNQPPRCRPPLSLPPRRGATFIRRSVPPLLIPYACCAPVALVVAASPRPSTHRTDTEAFKLLLLPALLRSGRATPAGRAHPPLPRQLFLLLHRADTLPLVGTSPRYCPTLP